MLQSRLFHLLALPILLPAGACFAEKVFPPMPHVGPDVFPIFAWDLTPSDPGQLQLMKEAGINVAGFCVAEELDRVAAAGLTCIVRDPRIAELAKKGDATDAEIRDAVAAVANKIASNRTAFGVYLRDEPGEQQMPILGRLAAEIRRVMPDKLPYVNLLPNYATSKQLGSASYEDYLRAYLRLVKLPYLSWDNYSLIRWEMLPRFYDNLETVRKVTLEAKIPFWNCILSTASFEQPEPSDASYNLQIYSTMAYGGRAIELYTYFTGDIFNFRMAPIDHYGHRTATWYALRRSAAQIHALAPTLVRLRSTGIYHWPVTTAAGTHLLANVKTNGRLLIGEFVDDQQRPWVMLVNKSLKESYPFRLVARAADARFTRISPVTGQEKPLRGGDNDWLAPGGGMLIRIDGK